MMNLVSVMARHVWSVARDFRIGVPHLRELGYAASVQWSLFVSCAKNDDILASIRDLRALPCCDIRGKIMEDFPCH